MTTIQTIKSQSPYFDDFDPAKDYVQVLFRPGFPVQARELTTLQSFLQEQVSRHGDYAFKEGDVVKNAEVTLSTDVYELNLTSSANSEFPASAALSTAVLSPISNFVGRIISNQSGTIKAKVRQPLTNANVNNYVGNIYIDYITDEVFDSEGGFFYAKPEDNTGLTQTYYNTFNNVNKAVIASTNPGVYYVKGVFVQSSAQSILVNNTGAMPSINLGFDVSEAIITQNDDATLYDNARGSTNEGAPGGHRLKYTLTLTSQALDAPSTTTFYRIASYINGVKQEVPQINKGVQAIIDIMARRTFDESGNYALRPFTHTLTNEADSDKVFGMSIGPSKAYVKGYEIDITAAMKLQLDRGLDDHKLNKNFKMPVVGTTSVTVTGVTGTLPGSTTGAPYTHANRLQLTDGTNVIGVAKAWAIKDSFQKGQALTKLYLYDIRMFNVITTTGTLDTTLVTGNDIYSGKTRGLVYTEEGSAGVAGGVAIINVNGKLKNGAAIGSETLGTTDTISSLVSYSLENVTNVTAANGFACSVTANSIENDNSTLMATVDKHIKTLKDGSTNIIDNDFNVLENTGGAATVLNAANGNYDSVRVDDQTEITKTLKFAYLKIHNPATRGTTNYGWSAKDKEISLYYPDLYRVYSVNESTDNTFDNGRFTRLNVTTAGVIPQGSVVTGATSGAKAIVALSNSNNINEATLASGDYHKTRVGTGSSGSVEVIFTKGTAFTTAELLTVETPSTEVDYTYQVTYTGVTASVGVDSTGNFMQDTGQRKEFYDVGRLVRNENVPAPSNDLIVFFSYFEADPTTAHYYSVDSYANEDFWKVDSRFNGTVTKIAPKTKDGGVELRNVIDFRLRVQPITDVTKSPLVFSERVFYDQDRIEPASQFTTDFYEYLGRTDGISLEKTGELLILSGVPSETPKKRQVSVDGMPLFWLNIPPVVRYPEDEIYVEVVDNRRYTMKDIGEIDRRLNRFIETTQLSLLELQALNDDNSGRTKSGFVVDNFTVDKADPSSPSAPEHPEYNATVDIIEMALIPAQTSGVPIEMDVSTTSNVSTFFDNYYLNSFTEEAFSTQLEATTSQRINPYATWAFDADISLNPSEDNWNIRKDDYFTSLYGELKPFDGSPADFANFNKITTKSPGGRSTTVTEWIGRPTKTTTKSAPHTIPDWSGDRFRPGTLRRLHTETAVQAARNVTTTTFDKPRSTGEVTSTLTGTKVIENPQDYFMRSIAVTYNATGLKPNTAHFLKFGGKTLETITSDNDGKITGTFTIPAQTFKAGTETVEIVDTRNGNLSFGYANFSSIGHLQTFKTVAKTATKTITKGSTTTRVKSKKTWFTDPIAQMFMLPISDDDNAPESSIITSVDLWFSKVDTRNSMNKVKVEIRKTYNGYPGGNKDIIGESQWIDIGAANETTVISDAKATNFKFKEPVALRGETEYAIVVKSPSDSMSVYVAEIGEPLIDGTGIHTDQPNVGGYYGSFFKSQNASTWTADQNKDMTYRLKRAKFDKTTEGQVQLVNKTQDVDYHKGDIGAYNQGLAMETFENSNYVRVFHPNHGMHYNNAQVTISGVTPGSYNSIMDSDLNGTHSVLYPTLNTYMIKTPSYANKSGKINTGIWTTFATQDIVYDSIIPNLMPTKEELDSVRVSVTTVETAPVNLAVANNKIVNQSIITPVSGGTFNVENESPYDFTKPMIIRSATNAQTNDLVMNVYLSSGTDYTSPIIKKGGNLNPIVFRNITGNLLTDSDLEGLTQTTADSDDNVMQEFVSYIQGVQSELEHSAYVTDQIDLEIPADGFTIKFMANMEPGTKIEAAYKARQIGDDTPFEDLEWIDFPQAQQITEDNYGDFGNSADFRDYTMAAETNFEFQSYKVRLRMRTENEALIPMIRALRVIADI